MRQLSRTSLPILIVAEPLSEVNGDRPPREGLCQQPVQFSRWREHKRVAPGVCCRFAQECLHVVRQQSCSLGESSRFPAAKSRNEAAPSALRRETPVMASIIPSAWASAQGSPCIAIVASLSTFHTLLVFGPIASRAKCLCRRRPVEHSGAVA